MSGPPPTPLHLRVLRGNPGKRRLRNNLEPPIPPQPPEPPGCLSGYALDEWHRIGPELHRLGLLTNLDTAALGAYCGAYGRWRLAEELLAKTAEKDPAWRVLTKIARDACQAMVNFGQLFGLTPISRLRLGVDVHDVGPSKFHGLIGGE